MLGGNGSPRPPTACAKEGLNVIALPKTIDNDTFGTDLTFGFTSAVEVATRCIDDIHTTASSHGRVFVIEIMGHKVGWIPLYSAVAGGADVCLIPEIPYDIANVQAARSSAAWRPAARFTIVVVAEGAISQARTPPYPRRSTRPSAGRAHLPLHRLRPGPPDRGRRPARDPRRHSRSHPARRRARRPGSHLRVPVRRRGCPGCA